MHSNSARTSAPGASNGHTSDARGDRAQPLEDVNYHNNNVVRARHGEPALIDLTASDSDNDDARVQLERQREPVVSVRDQSRPPWHTSSNSNNNNTDPLHLSHRFKPPRPMSSDKNAEPSSFNRPRPISTTDWVRSVREDDNSRQYHASSHGNNKNLFIHPRGNHPPAPYSNTAFQPSRTNYTSQPPQAPRPIGGPPAQQRTSSMSTLNLPAQPPGGFASSISAFKPVTSAKARAFEAMTTQHRKMGVPIAVPQNEPYRPRHAPTSSFHANAGSSGGFASDVNLPQVAVPDNLSASELESALAELVSSTLNIQDDDEDGQTTTDESGPEGLACKLLNHQKQGLKWLTRRESGKLKGGILADDMGLGKTVQMLALMLANRPKGDLRDSDDKKVKTTLIVCTPALMDQWEQEIKSKAPEQFTVAIHHGDRKLKSARQLRHHDVIITTYPTLQSEWIDPKPAQKKKSGRGDDEDANYSTTKSQGVLFDVEMWYRIILDEAHIIKNRTTKQHKACCALDGNYRWCLTGTPVQNGVADIFALFEFLGPIVKPLHEYAEFKARIETPIKNKRAKIGFQRLAAVLSVVMLRRNKATKIDGKSILPLPPREVILMSTPFMEPDEAEFYKALESKIALTVNSFIKHGGLEAKTIDALSLLLRMRQACSHPSLVTKKGITEDDDPDSLEKTAARTIPSTPKANPVVKDDLDDLTSGLNALSVQAPPACLVCSSIVGDAAIKYCQDCSQLFEKHSKLRFSTKVRQLLKCLEDIRAEGQQHKTIFTSMFDIVEPFLKSAGIKFVRFDGKKTAAQRAATLRAIREDPTITVLLLSLKSGSVGLNLTCCSRVVLMDLWWNPQIEEQAYGRAHRYPQKEIVKIYKITIADTVEDRILKLQEEKAAVAKAVVDGDGVFSSKANKLSVREMLYLFRGDGPETSTGSRASAGSKTSLLGSQA
ncbi:hypothetical protein OIO90_003170 [Microbotryomycetes sp. JL221]|nr:hypothetical protein OIO90_003170 [Microbotryomycetes sp. JL221]